MEDVQDARLLVGNDELVDVAHEKSRDITNGLGEGSVAGAGAMRVQHGLERGGASNNLLRGLATNSIREAGEFNHISIGLDARRLNADMRMESAIATSAEAHNVTVIGRVGDEEAVAVSTLALVVNGSNAVDGVNGLVLLLHNLLNRSDLLRESSLDLLIDSGEDGGHDSVKSTTNLSSLELAIGSRLDKSLSVLLLGGLVGSGPLLALGRLAVEEMGKNSAEALEDSGVKRAARRDVTLLRTRDATATGSILEMRDDGSSIVRSDTRSRISNMNILGASAGAGVNNAALLNSDRGSGVELPASLKSGLQKLIALRAESLGVRRELQDASSGNSSGVCFSRAIDTEASLDRAGARTEGRKLGGTGEGRQLIRNGHRSHCSLVDLNT